MGAADVLLWDVHKFLVQQLGGGPLLLGRDRMLLSAGGRRVLDLEMVNEPVGEVDDVNVNCVARTATHSQRMRKSIAPARHALSTVCALCGAVAGRLGTHDEPQPNSSPSGTPGKESGCH